MKKRLIIWCGIIFIIAIIIGAVILLRSNINQYLVTKSLDLLLKNIKAKISYQTVKGNVFTGLSLSDVLVKFASGDSLNAKSVQADYDLLSIIFKRKNYISNIKIIHPSIYLYSDSESSVSQPNQPAPAKMNFFPTALPLLFINHIEIRHGRIFSNDRIFLDTLYLVAKINLAPSQSRCLISKSSFFVPQKNIMIQNLIGNIDLAQNILQIKNFQAKTTKSSINLEAKLDLSNTTANFIISKTEFSLAEFFNQEGTLSIDGELKVSLHPDEWYLTDIASEVKYLNTDIKLQNLTIPDGEGILSIKNKAVKLNYRQVNFDTTVSEVIINAQYGLNPLRYQGKATLVNFLIPIKDIQLPLDGDLNFQGTKQDSIALNLRASCKAPALESICAQGSIKKGRILFEKVRIKDNTNILNLDGYYERKSFAINYDISNFSLSLAAEIFNRFGHANIDLGGFINGQGKFFTKDNMIGSSGTIMINHGLGYDMQFSKLNFIYDLDNITKLFGRANLSVESIVWKNNQLDNFGLSLQDSGFKLQAINWKGNSLYTNGKVHFNDKNIDCFVDSVLVIGNQTTIKNTKPFGFGINKSYFYLSDLALAIGTGMLTLDLTTNHSHPPNVNFKCSQIDLERISDIIQLTMPVKGIINIDIQSTVNQSDYTIVSSVYGLNVPISLLKKHRQSISNNMLSKGNSVISFKYIEGQGRFKDSTLYINNINLVYNQDTSKITGAIKKSNINLDITFNDPGSWLFFFLNNILDVQEGIITGQGSITGSFRNPIFAGGVNIRNAQMVVMSTKTQCKNVNANLTFDKQKIILANLIGDCGDGKIMAQGYTELIAFPRVETVSYRVEFTNAPLKPTKEIYAIADGNINIDYKPGNPFSIIGNVIIKEALLTYEFSSAGQISPSSQNNVNFNLKISSDRAIWLRNRDIDVELSAELNIFNDGKNTIYSGELNSLGGNFYYLDHILKLSKGIITLDNISELNPNLDIVAELPSRPIKIQTGQTEPIKIILSLTGRLKEPTFTFTSDPPMLSQEDIISYLTFNVTWQQMTSAESRDMFTSAISEKLLGYFERELTKRLRSFIYLDYLMIESGLLSGSSAKVTVGKYIGRNLYVSYEYNISGTTNDVFQIEYYISKSNEIIGERDRNGRYNLKYQYKIRY